VRIKTSWVALLVVVLSVGRNRSNAGTTLMRLANDPQLFFHTPPATPFAAADDLYRSLRHHTLNSNLQRALRSQHRHRHSGNARRFPPEEDDHSMSGSCACKML
jgi:hypothetical protein